jgi:hypothetical protein
VSFDTFPLAALILLDFVGNYKIFARRFMRWMQKRRAEKVSVLLHPCKTLFIGW